MTERLFGTDGIRSRFGEGILTQYGVKKLGRAIGAWLRKRKESGGQILIGMDTRQSGSGIEYALTRGLREYDFRVVKTGVLPTPAVAYLTSKFNFDMGIVISASHNPWEYNGIKCFGEGGFKLSDELEDEIEAELLHLENLDGTGERHYEGNEVTINCRHHYLEHLLSIAKGLSLRGMKLAVDCANGATSMIAPKLFEALGADLLVVNANPDGKNINERCGSLHPETLREALLSRGAELGLAFDGDGDRLIVCDERGNILDGDYFMATLATEMVKNKSLAKNTLVATQMSNVALDGALKKAGGRVIRTDVGDKYVLASLRKEGLNFGGEQSGHLIFLEHSTTGDGLVTAIELLKLLRKERKPASSALGWFKKYPQLLVNVRVAQKRPFNEIPELCSAIQKCREYLGENGRIYVRYSGTEPLARIMVEGPNEDLVKEMAHSIALCFND